ncbi:hypothetical protein [Streptomyces sp. PRh5]|uniref:hypothetical protein n=1 Tax=Streptomyces sp. PRh5 TaxID=1158056 RepID=UPI0018E34347|nr:hypothetical protein [Streptomyces sp. PRh5]
MKEVRDGLAGGEGEDSAVRPLLHTVSAHPGMRGRGEDFLDAAATELEFTGFATEADYQRYAVTCADPLSSVAPSVASSVASQEARASPGSPASAAASVVAAE